MPYQIITIPFDREGEGFSVEELNTFCLNKRITEAKKHFFRQNGKSYWTVFLEYEHVLEFDGNSNGLNESENHLYNKLREWRKEQAEKDGMPPFIIANNKQLVQIIKQAPKSLEALGQIDGIGRKKINKYGKDIIGLIQAFYGEQ